MAKGVGLPGEDPSGVYGPKQTDGGLIFGGADWLGEGLPERVYGLSGEDSSGVCGP